MRPLVIDDLQRGGKAGSSFLHVIGSSGVCAAVPVTLVLKEITA